MPPLPEEHALMMTLLYQTHSPFARKVLVFAHEAGLADRLDVVHYETSPTQPNAEVFARNPLGKVPVLLRSDGAALFDSDVICAYLDSFADHSLYPAGAERWIALRLQALAQGLAESGIALRWEDVRRPAPLRYAPLADGMTRKLATAYDWLEAEADFSAPAHIGHIALATALDWISFRSLPGFRAGRPRLSGWFDAFADRPSMRATPLAGDTHD
jgi:glutathione S-transferase